MKDVEILMPAPMPPLVIEALDKAFTLRRGWDQPDPERFLREGTSGIRGMAVAGHKGVDGALFDRLPNLQIVSSYGVGYDNVDTVAAQARGIVVTNTPDVLTDEVADLTIGLLIATIRHLPQADRYLRAGRWLEKPYPLTPTLRGRRIGILGLGRIGQAVARRLEGFGVEILYHGRSKQTVPYTYVSSLTELAEAVHVLVCVAPGGAATRNIVNADVIRALGPDGVLINVGRGSVVDEVALCEALRAGALLGAGLDVFADEPRVPAELIAMDNVVLLPHVGSASVETRRAMGQLVVDNLLSWFSGKGPLTPVAETPWSGPALA